MDVIDSFLMNNATPERHDLLMNAYNTLVTLGHVNHELNIQNYVNIEGSMDNSAIVMMVEGELLQACQELTHNYYIVCRKENTLKPYLNLFEVLQYLETTIESETVMYYYNTELDSREQLMSWVEVFRNDIASDISDLVLDVMDSLINNIIEIHELKADIDPIEPDLLYNSKLQYLKVLRSHSSQSLLAVELVKNGMLTKTETIEDMYIKYNKYLYSNSSNVELLTRNIISLTIMSNNDISTLAHDARILTSLLYDDVRRTNAIVNYIDDILNQTGELCTIMNTI